MAIRDLISHVYGPYPDKVVLKESFPPTKGMKIILKDLEIYCGAEPIGFDQSEYIITPPVTSLLSKNKNSNDVTFYGVLEVLNFDWLTDKGLEYLEKDIKQRDQDIHTQSVATLNLELKRFYGTNKPKIRICCYKNLLAHYLTADNDPEKLLIYSMTEGLKRTYWVQSLHASTFRQSQNFFDRYHLRALIVELIETDLEETPLERRNIAWLIDRYLAEILPRDKDRSKRLIKGELPEDVEANIHYEPRFPRHVPRSELRGYFAAHAEWLLANQIASNNAGPNARLFDVPQWVEFCKEARNDSIHAAEQGVRWGLADGCKIDKKASYDLASNLAKFGQTVEFWTKQLKNASQRKKRTSAKRKRKQSTPELVRDAGPVPAPVFQYDSDFSEPSTSEASEFEIEPPEPFLNIKPFKFCFQPPKIPIGRFTWICEGPGCRYSINLLDISPENLALLPETVVRVLKGKSWRQDESLQRALDVMVSHHYEVDHLLPNDIRLVYSEADRTWRAEHTKAKQKPTIPETVQVKEEPTSQSIRQSSRVVQRPRRFT